MKITLRAGGSFTREDATMRGMHFASAVLGKREEGRQLMFTWLVDPADGIIVDAKYRCFGEPGLMAAAEVACELLVGKNYEQAKRIGAELIGKKLGEEGYAAELNLVIDTIDVAAESCRDIPLSEKYSTPMPRDQVASEGGYPGWLALSKAEKIEVIEEILNAEVRPYIELDEGGIEILDLVADKELRISYQGSCTSCYSAIGSTLSSIQEIIQMKVHPDIVVVPNLDDLRLE